MTPKSKAFKNVFFLDVMTSQLSYVTTKTYIRILFTVIYIIFTVFNVRSNTYKVHSSVTPFAAQQLNHKLCPHVGI